jgi:hypothetical protein
LKPTSLISCRIRSWDCPLQSFPPPNAAAKPFLTGHSLVMLRDRSQSNVRRSVAAVNCAPTVTADRCHHSCHPIFRDLIRMGIRHNGSSCYTAACAWLSWGFPPPRYRPQTGDNSHCQPSMCFLHCAPKRTLHHTLRNFQTADAPTLSSERDLPGVLRPYDHLNRVANHLSGSHLLKERAASPLSVPIFEQRCSPAGAD